MALLAVLHGASAMHPAVRASPTSARTAVALQIKEPPARPDLTSMSQQMRDVVGTQNGIQAARAPSPLRIERACARFVCWQRAAMEADEQSAALISALRGTNINDDDMAAAGTNMKVVEMRKGDGVTLPLEYDPAALSAYFGKRPGAVLTRLAQISVAAGGWALGTAVDALRGRLTPGSEGEVAAVAGLRGVLVSLGPFYIKLGQALSIRPDILSPQAMVQLQQLCDKVPPFDSGLAMQTIRDDLGEDIDTVFSKITPEPVAAASLGQVYKATLRATGDEVAVKVHARTATEPRRPRFPATLPPHASHTSHLSHLSHS
jgi:hypothetical protein